MQFFKNNWIYIVIAFAVVLLGGIGYITYSRLNQLTLRDTTTPPSPVPEVPLPTDSVDTNKVELTFQITPPPGEELSCLELVATPLEGNVPLSVSFSGVAQELTNEEVSFTFDFGDETSQTVDAAVATTDGIVSQDITHTYTDPGEFTAVLTVQSVSGTVTSESCTLDIAAGGLAEEPIGGPSESTSVAQLLPTDTPVPSPTRSLTRTPTPTPDDSEEVPVPDVPEAGGFLPTALAALGGLAIILLAFAVL
ncbi:MAG: PKD domain-containing protein [Candidatus Roizmanbacteria bacterium]|nr:PKD domain-containing protein [Candidatus Roizmanbacteria bacterium]